jgi:hypothetical protein
MPWPGYPRPGCSGIPGRPQAFRTAACSSTAASSASVAAIAGTEAHTADMASSCACSIAEVLAHLSRQFQLSGDFGAGACTGRRHGPGLGSWLPGVSRRRFSHGRRRGRWPRSPYLYTTTVMPAPRNKVGGRRSGNDPGRMQVQRGHVARLSACAPAGLGVSRREFSSSSRRCTRPGRPCSVTGC